MYYVRDALTRDLESLRSLRAAGRARPTDTGYEVRRLIMKQIVTRLFGLRAVRVRT